MTAGLVYPTGRGAFPLSGAGGTLSYDGRRPGPYYRASTSPDHTQPGLTAALAVRAPAVVTCSINDYAVYAAVKALQPFFGATADGILGAQTTKAIRSWQKAHMLVADGVIGPRTCRALFKTIVAAECDADHTHVDLLYRIVCGTIATESGFDPGAVGVTTPQDLGIGQINGPAHPSMSVDARFDPKSAIPFVVRLVDSNLRRFNYNQDVAIVAYNLGQGGAQSWVDNGKPQVWGGVDVLGYIARIKAGA